MKKIKIFVAYHKGPIYFQNECIIPIHVGKQSSNKNLGIIGDNTGDNISCKNNDYAELTAQYWVRKNYDLTDIDYVGFCHYRRYMTYNYIPKFFQAIKVMYRGRTSRMNFFIRLFLHIRGIAYTDNINNIKNVENNFSKLEKHIEDKKDHIFLMKKSYIYRSLKHLGIENDRIREIFSNSLLSQYPEYKETLLQLDSQYKYHFGNMFIMDSKFFIGYAEWLFGVLFKFEEQILKENLYEYLLNEPIVESGFRPYGYIAELMLNLYILHNKNLSISKDLNVVFIG